MPRRRSATLQFNTIQLVGGLLPASLIVQIARQEAPGQKAMDYGLQKHQRLQVAVDQAWSRAKALWQEAQQLRQRGADAPWGPWFTRRLLEQVFGWSDLEPCSPRQIDEALFPISHQAFAAAVPLVLTGLPTEELDKGHRPFGQENRRRSPHSCLQECLNADDSANWGLLLTDDRRRLLHDNPSLVKPAYLGDRPGDGVELGREVLADQLALLALEEASGAADRGQPLPHLGGGLLRAGGGGHGQLEFCRLIAGAGGQLQQQLGEALRPEGQQDLGIKGRGAGHQGGGAGMIGACNSHSAQDRRRSAVSTIRGEGGGQRPTDTGGVPATAYSCRRRSAPSMPSCGSRGSTPGSCWRRASMPGTSKAW